MTHCCECCECTSRNNRTHIHTAQTHSLASTQQAVWRAIHNSARVCVCTQTGTGGRGRGVPEGRRGQWQSQLCVWWPSQRSGAPSWEHKATGAHARTHTHTLREEGGKKNNAIMQKLGRKIRHEGEPAGMKSWTGTKTGRACRTRSHALTLLQ